MNARRITRDLLSESALDGVVLAHNVRDRDGRIAFAKGRVLHARDAMSLADLPWEELHTVVPAPGDLHEVEAGERLARLAAGAGVIARAGAVGHWDLVSDRRGLLEVRATALTAVNAVPGLAVYTLPDGQVVDEGETIAGAKIVPFVIAGAALETAEGIARSVQGLIGVRPFARRLVHAIVLESLVDTALARFRRALGEKVSWFGSELAEPRQVPARTTALIDALHASAAGGAELILIAGSSAMDPLEAVFEALLRVGARIERTGVPAHPGSLLWVATLAEIPIVGMPTCGLFSRATVFDLVLPRLLAGATVDAAWLAALGHGGLLTRDAGSRFPPYRPAGGRGETD
jgi:hypothetical protein